MEPPDPIVTPYYLLKERAAHGLCIILKKFTTPTFEFLNYLRFGQTHVSRPLWCIVSLISLQCTATHCNAPQRNATHCNTQQLFSLAFS